MASRESQRRRFRHRLSTVAALVLLMGIGILGIRPVPVSAGTTTCQPATFARRTCPTQPSPPICPLTASAATNASNCPPLPTPTCGQSATFAIANCPPQNPCTSAFAYENPACQPSYPPPYNPPVVLPGPPQTGTTLPAPTNVLCVNGVYAATLAGCPQSPPPQTAPSNPAPSNPAPSTPTSSRQSQPPATVTFVGSSITFHFNQYLDLTHSIDINLDPGVEATGAQVSVGQATIQGSQVVWDGFTANAGDSQTITLDLVSTDASGSAPSGTPSVQSVTIQALDANGNPIFEQGPAGGPTIDSLPSCSAAANQSSTACSGAAPSPSNRIPAGGGGQVVQYRRIVLTV